MALVFLPCIAGPLATLLTPECTWTATGGSGSMTLSAGNRTAVAASDPAICRATLAHSTGKRYFEILMDVAHVAASGPKCGIHTDGATAFDTAGFWIQLTNGTNIYRWAGGSATQTNMSALSAGDVLNIAVDFDAGYIWYGKNGTWGNSGDPGAGTNPHSTGVSGAHYPVYYDTNISTPGQITARFSSPHFGYTPPTGFSAWR